MALDQILVTIVLSACFNIAVLALGWGVIGTAYIENLPKCSKHIPFGEETLTYRIKRLSYSIEHESFLVVLQVLHACTVFITWPITIPIHMAYRVLTYIPSPYWGSTFPLLKELGTATKTRISKEVSTRRQIRLDKRREKGLLTLSNDEPGAISLTEE